MAASRRKANPLGELLGNLLSQCGLSQADFCKRVGLKQTNLSALRYRAPTRLPKTINIDAWAKALALSGKQREQLQRAAELAWSPVGIQQHLKKYARRAKT